MKSIKKLSHKEMCRQAAFWSLRYFKAHVSLFEYGSFATSEHPDVLAYNNSNVTFLLEIKTSRSDFLADFKKDSRQFIRDTHVKVKAKIAYKYVQTGMTDDRGYPEIEMEPYLLPSLEKLIKQKPHLGMYRYYVCEQDLIKPEETGPFGLIYWNGRTFKKKKQSEQFRRSIYAEMSLLIHALRSVSLEGNMKDNVCVKQYR